MFSQSMAYKFQDMFFNGNPVTNNKEMVGIRWRLVNDLAAAQSIDGNALDVSPDTALTTTWFNRLLDLMDELQSLFPDGKPDAFLMNRTLKLRLLSGVRAAQAFTTTKDSYGREIPTWGEGGPMILDAGLKADQSTNIITNLENNDGNPSSAAGTETSIYAVKFGEEHLKGFQMKELEATDIGLLESRISYRDYISWTPGIFLVNPRAVARVYGIQAS